jgi:hypothetical protein
MMPRMMRLSIAVVLACAMCGGLGCKSRSKSQAQQQEPNTGVTITPAIKVMQRPSATMQLGQVDPAAARAVLPLAAPARIVKEPTPSANGAQVVAVTCYDELAPEQVIGALQAELETLAWTGLSVRKHPERPEAALSGERQAMRLTARIEAGSAAQCGGTAARTFVELTMHRVLTDDDARTEELPVPDAAPATP